MLALLCGGRSYSELEIERALRAKRKSSVKSMMAFQGDTRVALLIKWELSRQGCQPCQKTSKLGGQSKTDTLVSHVKGRGVGSNENVT